jgi:hypothetical protein
MDPTGELAALQIRQRFLEESADGVTAAGRLSGFIDVIRVRAPERDGHFDVTLAEGVGVIGVSLADGLLVRAAGGVGRGRLVLGLCGLRGGDRRTGRPQQRVRR